MIDKEKKQFYELFNMEINKLRKKNIEIHNFAFDKDLMDNEYQMYCKGYDDAIRDMKEKLNNLNSFLF